MLNENMTEKQPNLNSEKLAAFIDSIKNLESFKFLSELPKEFPEAKIYLVGGMNRDKILDRHSKDYDFVITKVSSRKLQEFLSQFGPIELVGASFGVFKFAPKGPELAKGQKLEPIDIALPRTEISTGGGGYRDFDVQSDPNLSIEDDLSRRDFTINAMAFDINNKELIDPFSGQQDLKSKVIRAVGKPSQRFKEDHSRVLRAIRQACQLDFQIEEKTWKAIKKFAPKILNTRIVRGEKKELVPYETISVELLKALKADPLKMLDLYDQSGLLKITLPELEACKGVIQPKEFHQEGDVFEHTKLVLEHLPKDASVRLRLAALLHDVGKPQTTKTPEEHGVDRVRSDEHAEIGAEIAGKICRRLKLPSKLIEEIIWLVNNHMFFVCGKVEEMRPNTIKKYFIDNPKLGDELLDLYYADTAASLGDYREKNLARHKEVRAYIEKMRGQFTKSEIKTFRHVINGNDIIQEFNLKPGPKIGEYLERADRFILEYITKYGKEPSKKEVLENLKCKNQNEK